MIWFLGGYVWMFIHRPFEWTGWEWLGDLQVERAYMLLLLLAWVVAPGKGWIANRIHWGVLAYYLAVLTCWVASPYRDVTGPVLELVSKAAVFYLLLVTLVRDEKTLRRLIVFFVASVGVYLLHSLIEYANGRYTFRMGIMRMNGVDTTFGDPNAFAATLVFTMPLTLPLWYDRPGKWMKVLLVLYTLASVFAVLRTGSRSGFVGMGVCALMFILISPHRKKLLLLAALGALAVAVTLPDKLENRFLTLIDSRYGPENAKHSADSRWVLLARCLEVWQTSPFVGYGPGSFVIVGKMKLQAHNVYGQLLAELGLVGVVGWTALLVAFAWNMVEVRRLERAGGRRSFPYHVSRAVCLSVLLMLLMGLSGHTLFRYNWMWFAAFQAAAVACARRRAAVAAPVPAAVTRPAPPRRLAVAGGG